MKPHGLLLCCALVGGLWMLGACQSERSMGWRHLLAENKAPELPQAPVVMWEPSQDRIMVRVSNPTNQPLFYAGYSPTYPQLFVEKRQWGRWVDEFWDWCGTGLERRRLPSGSTVTFPLPRALWVGKKVRVYTSFSTEDRKNRSLVLLYDSEMPRRTSER